MICFDTRSPLKCLPLHQIQLNFTSCVGNITFLELMLTFKSGERGAEVLPCEKLVGMCRWVGSHFHD